MSCYRETILPDLETIEQLEKELFEARRWINHYKSLYESAITSQKNLQDDQNQQIEGLKKELFEARYQASYYKALHQRNIAIREKLHDEHDQQVQNLKKKHTQEADQLKTEIAQLQAKLKKREHQLFGNKSEKKPASEKSEKPSQKKKTKKRKRGQQEENNSPQKRDYSHLPVTTETKDIPEKERLCRCCGAPYTEINATEDSEILEIHVKAHRRLIQRKKYRRHCTCKSSPIIITATKIAKIVPKSRFGNTVWAHCLAQKFWHGQPLCRVIQALEAQKTSLSISTIVGGFMKLRPLLKRVYEAMIEKSLTDSHWHADETGWKVFESLKGKANHRWFLWVFKSKSAAIFILNPSRSTQVIKGYFRKNSGGIISCDRYPAYFCFTCQSNNTFSIAYCWAHLRRDFLSIAKSWPKHENWAMSWVETIRDIYQLNRDRLKQKKGTLQEIQYQKALEQKMHTLKNRADQEIANTRLGAPCHKAIKSLQKHWNGLTTFVYHPHVPMDNNSAERELRKGVIGRKNYYGSGSIKSAEFTAISFTIIQTLLIWNINPQIWLNQFFDSMAENWEKDLNPWLPWNMSHDQLKKLALKKYRDPPSKN